MSDTPPPQMEKRRRRRLPTRISLVWAVPVAALAISAYVVVQQWQDEGPLIRIAFDDASGVRADETQLRYRDVVVGLVEEVAFTEGLQQVEVAVRIDPSVASFVDEEAEFWVVSPEVSARGVTGLDTVLSGVYLEGSWDSVAGERADVFEGRAAAPLRQYGQQGVTLTLRGATGEGLSAGTPILYRGIEVGQIGEPQLEPDGISVVADAFVREPEARLITTATRFWDASGFTFSFGAAGAQLDVSSLASLLSGGVSFDTFLSGGDAIENGTVFRLFPDEQEARGSVFAETGGGQPVRLAAIFEDTVSGLEVGADIVYAGVPVGTVQSLTGLVNEERFGDQAVRLLVTLEIQPGNLGLGVDADQELTLDFFQFAVERGLRAQLQSAGLLGGVQVALVQQDNAPEAELDLDAEPLPILPAIPAEVSDFNDTARGVFNRVNALPIEELLQSAMQVLDNVNVLLADESTRETPGEVVGLLGDVRALVASEGVQGLPDQASDILTSFNATAQELEGVVRELAEAGTVDALVGALTAAEEAADAVIVAVEDAPETLEAIDLAVIEFEEFIAEIEALPLDQIVARADTTLAEVNELLGSDATQGLTADVSGVLLETRGLLADVRASGMIDNANGAIDTLELTVTDLSGRIAPILDEALIAAQSISETTEGVPQLIATVESLAAEIDALTGDVRALPLNEVVARTNELLATTDALLSSEGVRTLPDEAGAVLTELQAVLAEVRERGLIDGAAETLQGVQSALLNVSTQLQPTLEAARQAAESVAEAAEGTPALVEQAERIAADIEVLTEQASTLPLEEIANRTSALLDSANTLVASEDTQRLPGALADALGEVQRLLIEVQEGGLIENANTTLTATGQAAEQVAAATQQLPGLVSRMNTLLAEAEGLISGYQASGALGSEARSTLRDIRAAAQSVDNLARAIERAPNSLLFGR